MTFDDMANRLFQMTPSILTNVSSCAGVRMGDERTRASPGLQSRV